MYNSFTFYKKYYILILELGGGIIKNSFDDLFEYVNNINDENKLEKPKKTNKTLVLMINLLSISLLIGGGYGVKYILDQQRDIKEAEAKKQELLLSQQRQAEALRKQLEKEKLEEQKRLEEEKNKKNINRDFAKLKEQNPDTVAWLYVPGTDIDMPIVQAKDNSYYLTHNFDKEYNSMGWAFADSKNSFPDLSQNTIMYGHTYKSTTIFSNLKNVLTNTWLNNKKNHIITFDTEKERYKFQVFSVYTVDETNDYLYISFSTNEKYQEYLNRETKRSIKNFNIKTTHEDKILTLSTCYLTEHKRLIVHAKLIDSE